MANTMTKYRIVRRISRAIGLSVFYTLLLFLCQSSLPSLFFVQSQQPRTTLPSNKNESPVRKLQNSNKKEKDDWIVTEYINKNNFLLDFVPKAPLIKVVDYEPEEEITVNMLYKGSVYLNAWASDEDFDVAPRYVERYSGIKYASIYNRFERSEQAYGYNFVKYNISKEDGKTREIYQDALKFGPMCIQSDVDERFMNEDCLYLNIWRPSRWKQSLNITTKCKQKFMGGGLFQKDCEVITNTKTIEPDGNIVFANSTETSSKVIPMGGLYDKDGSIYDEDTDILNNDNKKKNKNKKKKKKNRRGLIDLGDTLDNLNQALDDLNDVIEEDNKDSEDESNPNNSTNITASLGTYNVDGSGLLPVMVYIHGGGFMEGSGNDPMYDGSKAAGRGQVIVITLNYRLGIYGFLPSFGWDQWKVNGGMNGFMDIVEALIWINRNIISWGGNPDKITIFGPSSTPAVCLLTMCPLAVGRFQRAILQTSVRETNIETEVRDGRIVTQNGVNGASCLLSSQEPYQPLEGRLEVAYKFFDYINETYYNFPENPDPTREDIVDWLQAFAFNSTELWKVSLNEGTVFKPQRPAVIFDPMIETDNNLDENITDTQQRRTFMTWDNDIFPRMPVDLEFINVIDMIVGVRGRSVEDRPSKTRKPSKRPGNGGGNNGNSINDEENIDALEERSSSKKTNSNNIFLRDLDDSNRNLEEGLEADTTDKEIEEGEFVGGVTEIEISDNNGGGLFDFSNDDLQFDCSNSSEYGNETDGNETECEEIEVFGFDFSGTTSDQDLCASKQFAEIAARNVEGNVYGYVLDTGEDLFGYDLSYAPQRKLQESRNKLQQEHLDHPERMRNLQTIGIDYDVESMYFFDNMYYGSETEETAPLRKELFQRWINFAKTGVPKVSSRSAAETKKYSIWEPFPKGEIGKASSDFSDSPSYLYMFPNRRGNKKNIMVPLDRLVNQNLLFQYPFNTGTDLCTWVVEETNDDQYVEVLVDYSANTAFEYYVTILATLNPTINYVAEREYLVDLPPTLTPTTINHFLNNSAELSSSPRSHTGMINSFVLVLLGTAAGIVAGVVW